MNDDAIKRDQEAIDEIAAEVRKTGKPAERRVRLDQWSTLHIKVEIETPPTISLDEPCPHPARNGRHEIYLKKHGGTYCRACGAGVR